MCSDGVIGGRKWTVVPVVFRVDRKKTFGGELYLILDNRLQSLRTFDFNASSYHATSFLLIFPRQLAGLIDLLAIMSHVGHLIFLCAKYRSFKDVQLSWLLTILYVLFCLFIDERMTCSERTSVPCFDALLLFIYYWSYHFLKLGSEIQAVLVFCQLDLLVRSRHWDRIKVERKSNNCERVGWWDFGQIKKRVKNRWAIP